MNKLFLSSIFLLFFITGCLAQTEANEKIDSVSIKLFQTLKEADISLIEYHLVTKADLKIVLETFKDQMDEKERAEAEAEMDSLPQKARKKWEKKYHAAKEEANRYIDNWDNAHYLSSDIDIDIDKFTNMEIAKVTAKIEFSDQTFGLKYDCIKMPRGWVLGNRLIFDVIHEND